MCCLMFRELSNKTRGISLNKRQALIVFICSLIGGGFGTILAGYFAGGDNFYPALIIGLL